MKFEDLEVYKLSETLADMVWDMCSAWEYFPKVTVGKQLVRSADSIPANLSEGQGRFSFRENVQFCYIARGSLNETRNWVRRSFRRNLLSTDDAARIAVIMDLLGPKLNAYINSILCQARAKNQDPRTKN